MDSIQITVYDNVTIPLNKYPRKNTDKEKTDIIIIIFLMHYDFLKKLGKSFEEALKKYHECKEYYYVFKFYKEYKKYSAQEIIMLFKKTTDFFRSNGNVDIQLAYLNKMPLLDQIFYFYIKNKDFYLNLFDAIEDGKRAYFERRDYSYRISVPSDFYNNVISKVYNAVELMELNAYTQYLVERKIIQDLPIPKYIEL